MPGGKTIEVYTLRSVKKSYEGKTVLDIESLSFDSGLLHCIVGPNGSGKTTLMKLLAFLEEPSEGTIHFKGRPFQKHSRIPQEVRRSVSMVMQDHYLFEGSVAGNLSYGLRLRRAPAYSIKRSVSSALRSVGLEGFENRRANALSAGEGKRVAIARSLVLKPEVLLLDEPTANIDKASSEMIEQVVSGLKAEGMTVIMTTHDFDQAYVLSDKVMSLVTGRIVDVSPENVFPCVVSERRAMLQSGLNIRVATPLTGNAHLAIDPREILISLSELESSARNSIPGKIRRISIEDSTVKVYVDVGVELVSIITRSSLDELGLTPGKRVYLTFKATSVRIL